MAEDRRRVLPMTGYGRIAPRAVALFIQHVGQKFVGVVAAGEDVHLAREQVVPDRILFRGILRLCRFQPVVADMGGLFQRSGEDICRKVGQTAEVMFGFC